MIAIYDQRRNVIDFIANGIYMDKDYAGKICYYDSQEAEIVAGEYSTTDQAQYVLDQIASAIERGDKLYRMPSVEEVEKELSNKSCAESELAIKVHEISKDGLPDMDNEDLVGKVAFIFDGCIVSGWPLDNGLWGANTDVGHNQSFSGVTHWIEFSKPLYKI